MNEILILGLIILVGFIGNLLFKHIRIPESLFMILIGLAVGPIFGMVDQSTSIGFMPLVVTITLIMVLLDSTLSLNVFETVRSLKKAVFFTLLVMFCITFFVTVFMYLVGWEPIHALLVGVISTGTTSIVASFLLPRLTLPEDIKQILFIESIVNDITLITSIVVIIQIMEINELNLVQIGSALIAPVTTALVVGGVFTYLWVNVLWRFYKGEELTYVFTLGMLFILYSFVEYIGGNGAIAVLVLSISLQNLPIIYKRFVKDSVTLPDLVERFNKASMYIRNTTVNFSFFVRNFFFVYLGMIFNFNNADAFLLGLCLMIILIVCIGRYLSVKILSFSDDQLKDYTPIISIMVSRGFIASFSALLPSAKGIIIPQLNEIVLMIVVFSTLTTIIGLFIYERRWFRKTPKQQKTSL